MLWNRRSGSVLVGALAAVALCSPGYAEDWTMYLRTPDHRSFNASESHITADTVGLLQPSWVVSTGTVMVAAPTLVDGVLYAGDWAGFFYAIQAASGAVLWEQYVGVAIEGERGDCQLPIGVSGQAVVDGDAVYVPGGDSAVYALDKRSGRILWRVQLADPYSGSYLWSSIIPVGRSLYVGVASLGDCPLVRGALARIDMDHPEQTQFRYFAPDGSVGGGVWSTPAFDAATNTIFVTTGTGDQDEQAGLWGGTLMSLDATTLETKDYFLLPTNSTIEDLEWGSSPTLIDTRDGKRLVAATGKDGILYCLTRDDLQLLWTTQVAMRGSCPECGEGSLSTPAYDGKLLYVGAGTDDAASLDRGAVYAINPSDGAIVWRQPVPGTVIAPVAVTPGLVYAATTAGTVILASGTGERLWDDNGWSSVFSQPVVADATLYSIYATGEIVAWRVPAAAGSGAQH